MNDTWEKKEKKKKRCQSRVFPVHIFFPFSAIESGLFDFYKWQSIEDGKLESNTSSLNKNIIVTSRETGRCQRKV